MGKQREQFDMWLAWNVEQSEAADPSPEKKNEWFAVWQAAISAQKQEQPVAWRKRNGSMWLFFADADDANAAGTEAEPLYREQPLPSAQLMRVAASAALFARKESRLPNDGDLAAIVDAIQPQAECNSCDGFDSGCEECSGLGIKGQQAALRELAKIAHRVAHVMEMPAGFDVTKLPEVVANRLSILAAIEAAHPPAPVNQQMLAALKACIAEFEQHGITEESCGDYDVNGGPTKEVLQKAKRAIAAAKAAQAQLPADGVALDAEHSQEWWNFMIEDISAIDCRYRGDPSYDHDAYWMRERVIKVLEKRRDAALAAHKAQDGGK